MRIAIFASSGSCSHGIEAPPRIAWLMNPKSWLNMPAHTSADRKAGNAYGRIITTR